MGRSSVETPCPQCASRAAPGAARCASCGAPLLLLDDPVPAALAVELDLDASGPRSPARGDLALSPDAWSPGDGASVLVRGEAPAAAAAGAGGDASHGEPSFGGPDLDADGDDDAWVRPGSGFSAALPAAAFESMLDDHAAPTAVPPPLPARRGAGPEPAPSPAGPLPAARGEGDCRGAAAQARLDAEPAVSAPPLPAPDADPDGAAAPVVLRLRAFLVDAALVLASTGLPALLAARGLPAGVDALAAVGPPALGLVALAAFTYSVVAQATLGATPGQRLLGLRVTRLDGGAPGFGAAALRAALAVAGTAALGVGLLPALRGGRGRGLHDVVARTVVVLAP